MCSGVILDAAILVASLCSAMKFAAVLPWLGSVKHIWNTLSWPSVTVVEEAEGVSWNTRSL